MEDARTLAALPGGKIDVRFIELAATVVYHPEGVVWSDEQARRALYVMAYSSAFSLPKDSGARDRLLGLVARRFLLAESIDSPPPPPPEQETEPPPLKKTRVVSSCSSSSSSSSSSDDETHEEEDDDEHSFIAPEDDGELLVEVCSPRQSKERESFWCSLCKRKMHKDEFSAEQQKGGVLKRKCLRHAGRVSEPALLKKEAALSAQERGEPEADEVPAETDDEGLDTAAVDEMHRRGGKISFDDAKKLAQLSRKRRR